MRKTLEKRNGLVVEKLGIAGPAAAVASLESNSGI